MRSNAQDQLLVLDTSLPTLFKWDRKTTEIHVGIIANCVQERLQHSNQVLHFILQHSCLLVMALVVANRGDQFIGRRQRERSNTERVRHLKICATTLRRLARDDGVLHNDQRWMEHAWRCRRGI